MVSQGSQRRIDRALIVGAVVFGAGPIVMQVAARVFGANVWWVGACYLLVCIATVAWVVGVVARERDIQRWQVFKLGFRRQPPSEL
jgi:hypothetical protein